MALDFTSSSYSYLTPLISGGLAGLTVDVTLFPIDTLKTRLQSPNGFRKSGGFSGMYNGLGAVVVGSMPTAALFFFSYEMFKNTVEPIVDKKYAPLVHLVAASIGEVVACTVRVPTEIAKQRQQAIIGIQQKRSGLRILCDAYRTEGFRKGLYRGFFSTVLRDLPFSFVQFPLWEYIKLVLSERSPDGNITTLQVAFCGSVAGAIAGAVTTPLDVVKTRIMLAEKQSNSNKLKVRAVLKSVYREAGISGLLAGLTPRIVSFMIGGYVFFGAYDFSSRWCKKYIQI